MKGIYMGSKFKKYLSVFAITAFFLIFLVIPVCLYTVLRLGFPPVIGNLLSASTATMDVYDSADAPLLGETTMQERMADEAMLAYEALSPITPIHRFSVRYCHQGVSAEHHGNIWNIIRVELPEGKPLTREAVLSGELAVK